MRSVVCAMARGPVVASIAGGFVRVEVATLLRAWTSCLGRPGGSGDFRVWLAAHEVRVRRGQPGNQARRPASMGLDELACLCGVRPRRVADALRRLAGAGLIAWGAGGGLVEFPSPVESDGPAGNSPVAASLPGRAGILAIPRRILRFLARRGRPALIATVLGVLLRCVSRRQAGWGSTGRLKASWVATVFGVDLRRVKAARAELVGWNWLAAEGTTQDQWSWNRWGRVYRVNLGWETPVENCHPSPTPAGPELPPLDLDFDPVPERLNPDPNSAGDQLPQAEEIGHRASVPAPPGRTGPGSPSIPPADQARPGLPRPTLREIRTEDLRATSRTLGLHREAIRAGWLTSSEADRLRFEAAAVHALAVGTTNPPGLFRSIVVGGRWDLLTQADEDRARQRLRDQERVGLGLSRPDSPPPLLVPAGRLATLGAILTRFSLPTLPGL